MHSSNAPKMPTKFALVAPSKRDIFLATFRQSQPWSFPDSVIYYITKNPSTPKCYEKMIQSCKHFFIKNPILVVQHLDCKYDDHKWQTKFNGVPVDLKKIASRIWITNKLHIFNENADGANLFSPLISKFYQNDASSLLFSGQDLFVDDFKFLASKATVLHISNVAVIDKHGEAAPLENIIEILPKLECFTFYIDAAVITSKTTKNLSKMPHFKNILIFNLFNIPETFDAETFYDYIKENKNAFITLYFSRQISDDYKIRLQAVVDKILATENHEFRVPYISFDGLDQISRDRLQKLFCKK